MISDPSNSPAGVPAGDAASASVPVRRSPLLVALAWAVVAVPAGWGIYMTALTSVQLFNPHAAAPPPAAHTAPATPGLRR